MTSFSLTHEKVLKKISYQPRSQITAFYVLLIIKKLMKQIKDLKKNHVKLKNGRQDLDSKKSNKTHNSV